MEKNTKFWRFSQTSYFLINEKKSTIYKLLLNKNIKYGINDLGKDSGKKLLIKQSNVTRKKKLQSTKIGIKNHIIALFTQKVDFRSKLS